MKKHARKLSVVLTLVLILTSISFTGAFAGDNEIENAAPNQDQLLETPEAGDAEAPTAAEPAADEPVVQEPAADGSTVDTQTPAEGEPSVDATPADTPDADAAKTLGTEGQEAPEGDAEGESFTITWKVGKNTTTSTVKKNERPVFEGTPMLEGYDETNYRFTGWSDGTTKYAPEELPLATADAKYSARFVSRNVEPAAPVLKKNKNDQAFASYKSVYIEWNAIKDINGYAYDDDVKVKVKVEPKSKDLATKTVAATKKYHSEKVLDPAKTYTFKVSAVITAKDGTKASSKAVSIKGTPVQSIVYNVSIKQSGTLQRHAGNGPRTYSVKAGTTVPTIRFQTGKYIFEYKGSIFYISQTRVGRATATYNKKGSWNYMTKEAEYYIKDRAAVGNKDISGGAKSPTKNLIFVNTFCQHVYYFEGKNGAWECTDSWECGTGLPSTPTPTGNYGVKYIHDRIAKKNTIPWWNLFNGNAALHATKPSDHRVGMLISNGCVRNPDEKAKKIYQKCKLKTRVLIN